MPIVIHTKKAAVGAPKSAPKNSLPAEITALVQEVGALREQAEATAKQVKVLQAALKPYADRVKRLAELVSQYADAQGMDPDQPFTRTTKRLVLQVGKAGTVRRVADPELAMALMGTVLFLKKCSIGLGVIDDYLTPEQKQQVLTVERCQRNVAVMPRSTGPGKQ